jgi:RNA polymerase sigma factor (sigma-70 family)
MALPVHDLTLARARAGEAEALGELYAALAPSLYTLLKRICRSPEDAEDLLQESFLAIARDLPKFRGEGSLAGWAKRIAVTQTLMHYRQAGRFAAETLDDLRGEQPAPAPSPEQLTGARRDLAALLSRLPPEARLVLWLHEVEGYTHEEIGALSGFGLSPSYSKSQLARAHQKLRALSQSVAGGGSEESP